MPLTVCELHDVAFILGNGCPACSAEEDVDALSDQVRALEADIEDMQDEIDTLTARD